jgi:uncharacterized protein (DUF305 family)
MALKLLPLVNKPGTSKQVIMKKHETMQHPGEASMIEIMKQMNKKMETMKMSAGTDHEFAEMMITHHQAAVDMAQLELDSGHDDSLKKFAKKIIEVQNKEIQELEQWLRQHGK